VPRVRRAARALSTSHTESRPERYRAVSVYPDASGQGVAISSLLSKTKENDRVNIVRCTEKTFF